MPYVIKRIKGKRYVYQQFKIGDKTISKYIGNFDKIIMFYIENKDICGRRDLNPGHRRGRPAS